MPRNYQLKRNNPYKMRHNLYMQTLYIIKDYEGLRAERINLLYQGTQPSDGQPKGNMTSDPTQDKAIRMAEIDAKLKAIEQADMLLRGEYSSRTYDDFDPLEALENEAYFNYMHLRRNKDDTGPSNITWKRFRGKFVYLVAKNLNII